jgi:hypothetical protein
VDHLVRIAEMQNVAPLRYGSYEARELVL